jgi:hypothetical protein
VPNDSKYEKQVTATPHERKREKAVLSTKKLKAGIIILDRVINFKIDCHLYVIYYDLSSSSD